MSGPTFRGIHTGSFSTPRPANRPSSWSRRPTATTASTPGTSTAVDTVVASDGDLVGHNTDGKGFVESLRAVVDPTGPDVVVSPPRRALLRTAEDRGAVVLDGLGMLVGQGALAVRHWTGVEPDRKVMRAAAAAALGV